MISSYGAIPQDINASRIRLNFERRSSFYSIVLFSLLGITLIFGILFHGNTVTPKDDIAGEHWPGELYKMGGALIPSKPPIVPQVLPTNTTDAIAKGWIKMDEPCNPLLGEEWLYGGKRSVNISASVYFTPEIGNIAGVLSAIEVQYYGYIEENLVGTYFSEAKNSKDGTYHNLPVALRNGELEDLCDNKSPATSGNTPYVVISPGMANKAVPTTQESPELISNWKEGSCIKNMGYHWATDVETGSNLTYKAENLVPVVPMYSSMDGTINGIFFAATSRKQNWPKGCEAKPFAPCAVQTLNMWDGSPGLSQVNEFPFFMCSNFCGACQFTGAHDGMFTTMHWFFKNVFSGPDVETCDSQPKRIFCRSGEYPLMVSP